ncbi:MAG TPA: acetylxylan esterase [Opitutaceae bacterium]|nr:acetylxylan esterase [Opitutaceae bacterium]
MKRPPLLFSSLLLLTFVSSGRVSADTRADFLKVIDRPRVALAPQVQEAPPSDGLVHVAFSYASDAENRVPGILVKSASSTGRRPVVITLHGTGGNKQSDLAFMAELAKAGFIAVAIDAPYHGARSKAGKGSAEYVEALHRTFRTGKEHPFFFDSVWDLMRLIDYLETRDDVDAKRIGLFGISKGGIETYLTAAVDPRVAAAVPCIGVQSFRWAVENNAWQSRIGTIQAAFDAAAKDTSIEKPGADFVHTFYDRVAPGLDGKFDGPMMLPLIAPRPLFSINGETDDRTPLPGLQLCTDAARAAYRAAGAEEKFTLLIQPKTGHKVLPTSYTAAREWFVRWLKP